MGQQSFTPEEILAASFAYTRTTVEGAGAIKGKNCQIQSIDPITGGVRITFVWYLDDGTEQTDTADVMNGADGKGIKSVAIDSDEHLIITYTDNTTSDAGKIEVQSAVTSVNGKKGDVQLKTSDITNDSDYVSDANYVHTDNNYDDTAKGIVDGVTAELAKKVDKVTGKDLSTNDYTNADKAIVDNVATNLAGKVDKVSGKDLSTNDYTNTDKAIVDGVTAELANKADNTDVIDSASYDSTNHTILFKHGSTTLFSLDAAAFVKDGMIDTVEVTGGNLVITFNTDAGKQDISIPISDIFDANNYYNKTAIDNLLSAKQDTLTFDNTPTENSNNPVKSGGVYSSVNSLKETLKQQINYDANTGVKNVLDINVNALSKLSDNSYNNAGVWSDSGLTAFGITWTVNADGSIKMSGTNNSNTGRNLNFWPQYGASTLRQGRYILSIRGVDNNAYVIFGGSSGTSTQSIKTDKDITIDVPSDYASFKYFLIQVAGNASPTNTIKLMIRDASITDETMQGNTHTNEKLTQETTGLIDNQNVNGAVNMLKNTATTQVINGVTFTVNDDGTVTANGTATADAYFLFSTEKYGVNGEIILSGCPSGGSSEKYWFSLWNKTDNTYTNDLGNGANVAISSNKEYRPSITIKSGQTVNNLVFKPMITVPSYTGDYVPYAKSNRELTEDVKELTEDIASITKYKEQFYSFYQDWGWTSYVDSYATSLGIEHSDTLRQLYEKLSSNQQPAPRIVITVNSGSYTNNSAQFLRDICDIFGITGLAIGYFEIQGVLRSSGRMIIKAVPSGLDYVKYAYLNNWELSGSVKQINLS